MRNGEKKKKVLIALDYNPTAQKVAEEGYAMAKSMGAEVTLLHVISDPTYYSSVQYSPIMGFGGFMATPLSPLDHNALQKASLDFLNRSKSHLDGDGSINTLVSEGGDFAESIIKTAKDRHADIIVLGSHSRKWLEDIVLGSVAEKVLRESDIPLFIVPTKKKK
jgi:nucleotide-binding universal stress UspA family protein